MKKSRFSEQGIAALLKLAKDGTTVKEARRMAVIYRRTYCTPSARTPALPGEHRSRPSGGTGKQIKGGMRPMIWRSNRLHERQ